MFTDIRAWMGGVIILAVAAGGCGLVGTHIDCTQVAQQQRAGQSNQEIASSMDRSVDDVQSCSETTPRREASSSNYDQPLMPTIPNISPGAIHPSSVPGIGHR